MGLYFGLENTLCYLTRLTICHGFPTQNLLNLTIFDPIVELSIDSEENKSYIFWS